MNTNNVLHVNVVGLLSVCCGFEPLHCYRPPDCKTLLPFCVLAGTSKKTYSGLSARDFNCSFFIVDFMKVTLKQKLKRYVYVDDLNYSIY